MRTVDTLSPIEVSRKYLNPNNSIGKIDNDFNLYRVEEVVPLLSFPNVPFRNTAHGFIILVNFKTI